MKFAHSIFINTGPDWHDHLMWKWIYLLEKARLGLVPLPRSYKEVDPSVFITATTPVTPRMADETSPLISTPSQRNIPSEEDILAFFGEALDDQVHRITGFYKKKEAEIFGDVARFDRELHQATVNGAILESSPTPRSSTGNRPPIPSSFTAPDHIVVDTDSSATTFSGLGVSIHGTSSSSSNHRGAYPASLNSNLTITTQPTLRRSDSIGHGLSVLVRNLTKSERNRLRKQATALYVSLNELNDFQELNRTGFSKILKKFDKVTGYKFKERYLSERVDSHEVFAKDGCIVRLREREDLVVDLYAAIATDNNKALALSDLKSHLREHIVWERNTVWKDMVALERRAGSVRRRPTALEESSEKGAHGWLWHAFCVLTERRLLSFIVCTAIFGALLNVRFLASAEQQNCFAILVYASALWALEVLPLFVTSMTIPFLVVVLRVMRTSTILDDGTVDWVRLDAKSATKRVFADMFSPVIMLLLGGFSLASALSKHNIAKGLASLVLDRAGSEPKYVVLANMFVSTFASMWISNVAAPPILRNLPSRSPYAKCLVLGIALAANVGGMASPISSPQNIIAMGVMSPAVSWLQWFAIALPVCLVTDFAIWLLLLLIYRPHTAMVETGTGQPMEPPEAFRRGRGYFAENPLTLLQWYVLGVTGLTIALWCVEASIEGIVGDMGIIAIIPIVAFYATGVLSKDDWNSQLWTVVMLAMGGICLGKAVDSSGLLAEITGRLAPILAQTTPFMCIVMFSGVVLFVASFISHTVAALILLPVVAEIGAHLPDPQPRMFVMAIALMCSGAMGLPVSSFPNMNAISLEDQTGEPWLAVTDFLKVGLLSSAVAWVAILGVGYQIMMLMGFK
ncbi:low-affinity phosphate transporter [Irineochytrium annulatum]|nr:low-affinity phosphate transporter [Irineochytrium annulatum]